MLYNLNTKFASIDYAILASELETRPLGWPFFFESAQAQTGPEIGMAFTFGVPVKVAPGDHERRISGRQTGLQISNEIARDDT